MEQELERRNDDLKLQMLMMQMMNPQKMNLQMMNNTKIMLYKYFNH
jgi:hypothetical protein